MTQEQLYQQQTAQKELGDIGEDFVLRFERQRLRNHPQVDSIRIIGRTDVGTGYDILSFQGLTSQYPDRFIEVKTYSQDKHFFLSPSEQNAATKYGDKYFLYLVDKNHIHEPGYKPVMIQDPINNIADSQWQEKSQTREYVFTEECQLPADIDVSTVLVGCFRSNEHLLWIRKRRYYNVRASFLNGSVGVDDVTESVRYLILYDSKAPSIYRCYTVESAHTISRNEMLRLEYPSPHACSYIVYSLKDLVKIPELDILRIIRTYNDKLKRTSGTPIFIQGSKLRSYILGSPAQTGLTGRNIYNNEGKPWSEVQVLKLSAMYQSGINIALLAHHFKRTSAEIRQKLSTLGLLS